MRKILVIAAAAIPLQAYAPPPPPPAPRIVAPAKARADPQSPIRAEDYPDWALAMGEEGRVRFTLDVGANGRVAGCTITRSSGSTDLDSATCRLMTSRARFTPAVDSTGSPAPSRVGQEVSWKRPPGAPPKFQPHGYGMISHSVAPEAVVAVPTSPVFHPPIVAIPQDGPGEAELSVWDGRSNALTDLGRYESIPACRKVKAQLRLRSDQRAWCTVAAENPPGLDHNWRPPY